VIEINFIRERFFEDKEDQRNLGEETKPFLWALIAISILISFVIFAVILLIIAFSIKKSCRSYNFLNGLNPKR